MLDIDELEELLDTIREKIMVANRTGELEDILRKLGLTDFIKGNSVYDTYKDGKIVVIGGNEIKKNDLLGVIKSLGIDKNRFEFCLDYDLSQNYNYKKLRYSPNYRAVLFGPIPHSSKGKNKSSNAIAEMENNEGYPRVFRLGKDDELKITKTNFKYALETLISEDYI